MRAYDFSPLYRSTIGFDRLASVLDNVLTNDVSTQSYPPYNIEKTGEDAYRITLAVAGFTDEELNIEAKDGQLVVSGKKSTIGIIKTPSVISAGTKEYKYTSGSSGQLESTTESSGINNGRQSWRQLR
jgi:HSP20 family molecular chaperone IbpA